jgi:hypothetical protein
VGGSSGAGVGRGWRAAAGNSDGRASVMELRWGPNIVRLELRRPSRPSRAGTRVAFSSNVDQNATRARVSRRRAPVGRGPKPRPQRFADNLPALVIRHDARPHRPRAPLRLDRNRFSAIRGTNADNAACARRGVSTSAATWVFTHLPPPTSQNAQTAQRRTAHPARGRSAGRAEEPGSLTRLIVTLATQAPRDGRFPGVRPREHEAVLPQSPATTTTIPPNPPPVQPRTTFRDGLTFDENAASPRPREGRDALFGRPDRATGTSGAAIDDGPPARGNPRRGPVARNQVTKKPPHNANVTLRLTRPRIP